MTPLNIAIVGANRGIGLELTKQLADQGHNIYAFCRTSSKDLDHLKNISVTENFEVTDSNKMQSSLKTLEFSKGNFEDADSDAKSLDVLLHVSGILHSDSLDEINEDEILSQFKVNALAPILSVNAFLPYLKEGAKVGLVTSRMGSVADNTSGGMYGYRMSKAALNMAGKSLSEDLKDYDISVLLLHPGYVKTDMTGHQGHITPVESARGLIKIMMEKELKDTGTFWHVNGEQLPW
jgi:NAD(P)-dependent dehydrogenase (short-subunit alcohol dehydrogenase family)